MHLWLGMPLQILRLETGFPWLLHTHYYNAICFFICFVTVREFQLLLFPILSLFLWRIQNQLSFLISSKIFSPLRFQLRGSELSPCVLLGLTLPAFVLCSIPFCDYIS